MANQTVISIDLSNSLVTNVTVADLYATRISPTFTGNVGASGASSVTLPANTSIGTVTSAEIAFIDGVTSSIQSQIDTLSASISGTLSGNLVLPPYSAYTSGAIVFEGSTADAFELFLVPTDPASDVYLTLPAITDTLVTKTSTDVFTNKTFDTAGTNNVFRINGNGITAITGTGSTAVLQATPTITNPVINSQSLTGYTGSGTLVALSVAPTFTGTTNVAALTTSGNVIVGGNLTVNGITTTINSNTLVVDDKNIELGSVASIASVTGTITTTSTTTTVTGLTSTAGMIPGMALTKSSGVGAFGGATNITSIDSSTQITITSDTANTIGSITFSVGGATDVTANGGGITLIGATNKTIIWDSTNSNWTSSENFNIATGKTFKINNTDVLTSTTVLGKPVATNASDSILTLGATQTLTNKTLTAPAFTNPNQTMTALMGYTSTATAAGTTTLTNTSSYYQQFTGSTTQTVVLPATSTLATGWTYHIVNNSTGNLTVQSSGLNTIITVVPGTTAMVTCINTAVTDATGWESGLTDFSTSTGTGAVVMATSPTLTTPTIATINASAAGTAAALWNTTLTTGSISIGGALTNGTITIGGTAITGGTININPATLASTTNIAYGNVTTGVKAVNIGTGATAGTTTITIGSTTGSTTNILGTAQVGGNAILTAASTTSALTSFGASPAVSTSLTTPSASFDLLNTTATTVNAFGAATTLSIGNTATGAQTVNMFNGSTATGSVYTLFAGATSGTKAINIGTAGIASSTTTVTIGSAVASATGITKLNTGLSVATPPAIITGTTYTATLNDTVLIFNTSASSTLTLPAAATYPGKTLMLKQIAAFTVISASSNVVPLTTTTAGTAILSGAGKFAYLVSDGTNWITMMSN